MNLKSQSTVGQYPRILGLLARHPPAVATGCVDGAVLAPHYKVVDVAQWKRHGGDGHRFALLEHQLQTVLQGGAGGRKDRVRLFIRARGTVILPGGTCLRLREHVQTPGAHLPIGGDADQVVGVLGSHHVHAVDGVLRAGAGGSDEDGEIRGCSETQTLHRDPPTVCAAADSGVLCTGVRLLLRLSHRTIWPE